MSRFVEPVAYSKLPAPEIGPGWTIHIVPRKNQGPGKKNYDKFMYSPHGRKFRSMPDVLRYIGNPIEKPKPQSFAFAYPNVKHRTPTPASKPVAKSKTGGKQKPPAKYVRSPKYSVKHVTKHVVKHVTKPAAKPKPHKRRVHDEVGAVGYRFFYYIDGNGWFEGMVAEILISDVRPDAAPRDRRVRFEDGDVEDLTLDEIRKCPRLDNPKEESSIVDHHSETSPTHVVIRGEEQKPLWKNLESDSLDLFYSTTSTKMRSAPKGHSMTAFTRNQEENVINHRNTTYMDNAHTVGPESKADGSARNEEGKDKGDQLRTGQECAFQLTKTSTNIYQVTRTAASNRSHDNNELLHGGKKAKFHHDPVNAPILPPTTQSDNHNGDGPAITNNKESNKLSEESKLGSINSNDPVLSLASHPPDVSCKELEALKGITALAESIPKPVQPLGAPSSMSAGQLTYPGASLPQRNALAVGAPQSSYHTANATQTIRFPYAPQGNPLIGAGIAGSAGFRTPSSKMMPPKAKAPFSAPNARPPSDTTLSQAAQSSLLARQALKYPRIKKNLYLSLALVRINPRKPFPIPPRGTVLNKGFAWANFRPLLNILRDSMRQYYELSTNKCQSRDQQDFNNKLVNMVKIEAVRYGWKFDGNTLDDKKVRDRIRCFYKTHIQNAKKRLNTMLNNPQKRANIKALAAHFHVIEDKATLAREEGSNYQNDDESISYEKYSNSNSFSDDGSEESGEQDEEIEDDEGEEEYDVDTNDIAKQMLSLGATPSP